MTFFVWQSMTVARKSQPSPSGDIGDITNHLLAGRIGGEVAVDQIGDGQLAAVVVGEAGPPRSGLAGDEAQVTHDGADEFGAGGDAAAGELGVYAAVAVGLVGVGEDRLDQGCEFGPAGGGGRLWASFPVEEPGRGYV